MAINRFYIHKVTLRGAKTGNSPVDRSKLGTKRNILTDKNGIPLSVIISSASTHDINLVTEVVDNAVIKRKKRRERRTGRQHLCLDKGYNSVQEEQELIKRGYLLHIPIRKKKKKKTDKEEEQEEAKLIPFRIKILSKEMGCRKNKFMAQQV